MSSGRGSGGRGRFWEERVSGQEGGASDAFDVQRGSGAAQRNAGSKERRSAFGRRTTGSRPCSPAKGGRAARACLKVRLRSSSFFISSVRIISRMLSRLLSTSASLRAIKSRCSVKVASWSLARLFTVPNFFSRPRTPSRAFWRDLRLDPWCCPCASAGRAPSSRILALYSSTCPERYKRFVRDMDLESTGEGCGGSRQ